MPISTSNLMRTAKTGRIQDYLTGQRGVGGQITPMPSTIQPGARPMTGPALLGPPVHQSGAGGTIDPTTFPFAGGGVTPSVNPAINPANPSNMAAWQYENLMRSANQPINGGIMPPRIGGGSDEPGLPIDPGPVDPPILVNPPPLGTGDDGTVDPGHFNDPRGPLVEVNPGHGHVPNPSGISGGNPPTGNYFPTFSGNPHIPSTGGQVGHGTTDPRPWYNQRTEPWYGRLARTIMPYGSGQIAHLAAEAARRLALRGAVGGQAHVSGRHPATVTGPARMAANQPTSGLLTPEQYRQQTFGGLTPTGYRDPAGASPHDSHAQSMMMMAAAQNAGRANRNLVSDRMEEARSLAGPRPTGNQSGRAAAFMAMYGPNGIRTNINPNDQTNVASLYHLRGR